MPETCPNTKVIEIPRQNKCDGLPTNQIENSNHCSTFYFPLPSSDDVGSTSGRRRDANSGSDVRWTACRTLTSPRGSRMIMARLRRPPLAVLALAASLLLLILAGSAESTKIKGKNQVDQQQDSSSIKRGRDRPPVDRARVKSRVALCSRNQAAHSSGSSAPIKSTRVRVIKSPVSRAAAGIVGSGMEAGSSSAIFFHLVPSLFSSFHPTHFDQGSILIGHSWSYQLLSPCYKSSALLSPFHIKCRHNMRTSATSSTLVWRRVQPSFFTDRPTGRSAHALSLAHFSRFLHG